MLNMSKNSDNLKSLSKREIKIISELESSKKYYFTKEDIKHHFDSKNKINYAIHRLIIKKRIIKLNKSKYYLIPIKAKSGSWSDEAFIIADEILNGKNYYIGGWSAAKYWDLTNQVPMKTEIYTNKRNGSIKILTENFIFKKTTQKRINNAITKKIKEHEFKILNKKESLKWIKSKN